MRTSRAIIPLNIGRMTGFIWLLECENMGGLHGVFRRYSTKSRCSLFKQQILPSIYERLLNIQIDRFMDFLFHIRSIPLLQNGISFISAYLLDFGVFCCESCKHSVRTAMHNRWKNESNLLAGFRLIFYPCKWHSGTSGKGTK